MPDPRITFNVTLGELSEVPGSPYAYWAPKSLRDLFQKYPPLDRDVAKQPDKPKIANVKQGLATADDLRFTRYWWEVPVEQIATSREETFQGKKWVPFAKGGKPFFIDVNLIVSWFRNGEEIRNSPNAVIRNESFYFRSGLIGEAGHEFSTAVREGRLGMAYFPSGVIFATKAAGIFLRGNSWSLLGWIRSRLPQLFINILREHGSGQHAEIAKIPCCPGIFEIPKFPSIAQEAHNLLREWTTGNEIATVFVAPWILQIFWRQQGKTDSELLPITKHPLSKDFQWSSLESAKKIKEMIIGAKKESNVSLVDLAKKCVQWEIMLRQRIEEIQRQIDDEVYKLYGISEGDRALIEAELSKSLEEGDIEEEEEEESEDNGIAEEETPPEGVIPAEEHVRRLVHYIVHEVIKSDADGIVPLSDTYTVDGHLERGLIYRVTEKFKEIFGESAMATIEKELHEVLGGTLDSWLASEFFDYHVSLFRLRPIIWQITSRYRGKSQFNCFIYWHKLDKDTLRKVQEVYLRPSLDNAKVEAERQARQLAEKQAAGASLKILREAEKTWRQAQERYEELLTLNERIKSLFQPQKLQVQSRSTWVPEKVNEIVAHGYQPNRDYGVRVNIESLKQAGVLPASANRVKG